MIIIIGGNIKLPVIYIALSVIAIVIAIISILMQLTPNKLELALTDETYEDVDRVNGLNLPTRFFHIAVKNKHKKHIARNCYAFLTSLKDSQTGEEYIKQSSELKWRGYQLPYADILPQTYRKFDSFCVKKNNPHFLLLNAYLDSTQLIPHIERDMSLKAEYWVVSENFKTVKKTFIINLNNDLAKVSLGKN